ncbi:hypothetical protein LCGC14_0374430 [marine sediment metagenome]|uniref:Uncharacterized protein n=1 Tax=marine sediment metagenome TaxID=412755 RepID=A0A0F9WCX1_9ZZZZ
MKDDIKKKKFWEKVKERTAKFKKKKEEKKEEPKEEVKEAPKEEEHKELSLREEIRELKEVIKEASSKKKKKDKTFNLPSKVKRQLKKSAEKSKVVVFLLKSNRSIQPIMTKMENGWVNINGVPRNCSIDFTFIWRKKYPAIVLPEWDINPIGTKDYYDAVKDGRAADPIATVIRLIKEGEILGKGLKMGSKAWIFIGLAALAFFYVLFAGG